MFLKFFFLLIRNKLFLFLIYLVYFFWFLIRLFSPLASFCVSFEFGRGGGFWVLVRGVFVQLIFAEVRRSLRLWFLLYAPTMGL